MEYGFTNTSSLSFYESWLTSLCFTFQIYFDFSAYSEMAIGLGLIFGITLPVNFNSPFQALSLIDFWNRWNITLTKFIGSYIYFPLFQKISKSSSNLFNNHINVK